MYNIIESFLNEKNEEKAYKMKVYMRNQFEFLGIDSVSRKRIQKKYFNDIEKIDEINKVWVLQLWSYNGREFQYFAIDYLIKYKKKLIKEDINFLETLILTKSWWDTVDLIASNLIGRLCLEYPELIEDKILHWCKSDNIWLRRTAILFQLKYKDKTNEEILEHILKENISSNEFFIKKSIGWALREYSKTNANFVRDFLKNYNVSKLTLREASKYI